MVAGSVPAGRGHEGTSWASGNVPCLDLGGGYIGKYRSNNLEGVYTQDFLHCMPVLRKVNKNFG